MTATALAGKSNVGHGHAAADVSDFSEAVDDRVAALLAVGAGLSKDYDDPGNTLTLSAATGAVVARTMTNTLPAPT